MSRLLEEIRQQPERLEHTLRHELKRVERFKRLIGKRRPTLIVLDLFGERFGQCDLIVDAHIV